VLGYSAREVADVLDTTTASVNSSLQRARKALDERLPARTQQATLRRLGDERRRALVEEFVDAWEHADVDRLTRLLADDVTFSMPPDVRWWRGRDAIIEFLRGTKAYCPTSMWRPTHANGQIAIAYYLLEPDGTGWWPATITTLDLDGDRVRDVTAFVYPELFPRFGLPATVKT
jgi:RNA polymerase sigma-70 factor, ECF subfamily